MGSISLLAAVLVLTGPAAAAAQQPAIKTGVTLVPIDVRVLDRNGQPVQDLREDEFEILEDGVPQRIFQFQRVGLGAEAGGAATAGAATGPEDSPGGRVFLIVLGRGRLVGPSRELDALLELCRTGLRPGDQVAFMAYNRATPYTRDREALAAFVARYKDRHEEIEGLLEQWFSGLRARYGSPDIPPFIQTRIDALFDGIGGSRQTAERPSGGERGKVDEASDTLHRAALLAERTSGLPDLEVERAAERIGLGFDEFVELSGRTLWDLGNVHRGIEYLHYLPGEKHLLFVTRHGLFVPGVDRDDSLAAAASHARVTLNILFTGGPVGPPKPTARQMFPVATTAQAFQQMFAISDMRTYAERTGGQLTAFQPGTRAIERLEQASSSYYLLAYAPMDATPSGRFRRISVRVKRPGVQVLHRGGYYARPERSGFDARSIATYSRIASAGGRAEPLLDIRLRADAAVAQQGDGMRVRVEAVIDISSLKLNVVAGRHTGTLDVAIFCADRRETLVGETWQKLELALTPERYLTATRAGMPHAVELPVTGEVRYVKLIVYHYESDATGSIVVTLR
jgi:VWFA-related protein